MQLYLKYKLLTSSTVLNEDQEVVYNIRPELTFFHHKFRLLDEDNNVVYVIQNKLFRLFKTYSIKDAEGNELYTVRNRLSFFIKRNKIKNKNPEDAGNGYKLTGSVMGWHFTLKCNGEEICTVKKTELIKFTDRYLINIQDESKVNLCVAIALIIDAIYHRKS